MKRFILDLPDNIEACIPAIVGREEQSIFTGVEVFELKDKITHVEAERKDNGDYQWLYVYDEEDGDETDEREQASGTDAL